MKKPISFSNFREAVSKDGKKLVIVRTGNPRGTEPKTEGGLWDNIHKRRKAGKAPKKPGQKGYPKTLDIESKEAYEPITTKRSQALAKADAEPKKPVTLPIAPWDKKKDKDKKEGYVSAAQRMAVHATKADGGKGHPDNKKKSKKETVDEISRDDMVKKVSSTIGNKVPMLLTKHDDEKKKVKTGLDRLRKALGPNHVMNKPRA